MTSKPTSIDDLLMDLEISLENLGHLQHIDTPNTPVLPARQQSIDPNPASLSSSNAAAEPWILAPMRRTYSIGERGRVVPTRTSSSTSRTPDLSASVLVATTGRADSISSANTLVAGDELDEEFDQNVGAGPGIFRSDAKSSSRQLKHRSANSSTSDDLSGGVKGGSGRKKSNNHKVQMTTMFAQF